MVTFLSPFSGRKQLLPFHCQQGWLMEVEWSAFQHSKWESVLGNGRNTHLHLSPVYRRAVTAPEWMATYRAWQKNTKCLKVLTCAKEAVEGGGGPMAKEPPPANRQPPLCQEYPIELHLTASKTTGGVTSFNLGGRWRAHSVFGFCPVHLFSHLISFSFHLPVFVWCRRRLGSSASMPADSLSV